MILQSQAQFRFGARPAREASRLRIGMIMLVCVVAMLSLLNLLAGAA